MELCEGSGKQWESSRVAAPGHPSAMGTFTHAVEPPAPPLAAFSGQGLSWMCLSVPSISSAAGIAPWEHESPSQVKQLKVLLSLAISWGLESGWIRYKDREIRHQTLPPHFPPSSGLMSSVACLKRSISARVLNAPLRTAPSHCPALSAVVASGRSWGSDRTCFLWCSF